MKLFVVLVAVLLLVWLLLRPSRRRGKVPPPSGAAAPPAPGVVEGMVACAHCGVHVPFSAALQASGHNYCSSAHRDGGPRAP